MGLLLHFGSWLSMMEGSLAVETKSKEVTPFSKKVTSLGLIPKNYQDNQVLDHLSPLRLFQTEKKG